MAGKEDKATEKLDKGKGKAVDTPVKAGDPKKDGSTKATKGKKDDKPQEGWWQLWQIGGSHIVVKLG